MTELIPEDKYDDYNHDMYIKYAECPCGAKLREKCNSTIGTVHQERARNYIQLCKEGFKPTYLPDLYVNLKFTSKSEADHFEKWWAKNKHSWEAQYEMERIRTKLEYHLCEDCGRACPCGGNGLECTFCPTCND